MRPDFSESLLLTERARVETLTRELHETRLARQREAQRADMADARTKQLHRNAVDVALKSVRLAAAVLRDPGCSAETRAEAHRVLELGRGPITGAETARAS